MGALRSLLLTLAGGGSEAGISESLAGSKDFMETARQYLSREVSIEENGEDFVIEDDFGRGPLAGGKAEYFALLHGDIWQVQLEKGRLGGWRVTGSQRLEEPQPWICNLLERNDTHETDEKMDGADNCAGTGSDTGSL